MASENHFEDLPVGACYRKARSKRLRKKAAPDSYVTTGKRGLRKGRENPAARVREASCPLGLLGVGLETPAAGALALGSPKRKRC